MKKFIITLLMLFIFSSASFAEERINLAFNIDNNYVTYFLLTINSIFKTNNSDSQYYIYVVENDLNPKNKKLIEKFVNKNKQHVEFINISQEKLNIGKNYYYSELPITNIAFARIFLPELLPDLDRILYLDSDILVLSDIKELYNTNISGYAMGLALDFSYVCRLRAEKEELAKLLKLKKTPTISANIAQLRKIIKTEERYPYHNDGIILMDLKFMRKNHLTQRMVDYAKTHQILEYADQDVINNSMRPYIKRINPKWNNQYYIGLTLADVSEGGIIHYISKVKPWMTVPKKSSPERYMYYQNWFTSEFRFRMISTFCSIVKKQYLSFCKRSIDVIKIEIGYPDKNQETIHVAFTIDDNYWLYTLLTIDSILKNNKSHSPYHFYVVENNLTDANKQKMLKYVKRKHQEIEFINVDTTAVDGGKNLYHRTKEHKYISRIAMARIFLPNLLPKKLNKVLYLDSDLIITKDIKELYDIDISKYSAAMAGDLLEYLETKTPPKKLKYYNDGVILMNLDYWRKHKITEQMVNYMQMKKYLPKMDQDLINIILKNKIKPLDPYWNNQYGIIAPGTIEGIIHYTGPCKPWACLENYYTAPRYELRNLYQIYWSRSSLWKYQLPLKYIHTEKLYMLFGQKCLVNIALWKFEGIKK